MSWDVDATDGDTLIGTWNYTHNTSKMIYKVLRVMGVSEDWRWYDLLNANGSDVAPYLESIIGGLCEAPELFRSMNPENGWGDYDSLMTILNDMLVIAEAFPCSRWEASG